MPAVSPEFDQLLPKVPDGFTACTEDGFGHRVNAETAAARTASWQAEARNMRPSLHPANVRGVSRDGSTARFALPVGVLELRFPSSGWSVRVAKEGVKAENPHDAPDERDFLFAQLPPSSRFMVASNESLAIEAFLVKESGDVVAASLEPHLRRARATTTCAQEEDRSQRDAYRVTSGREDAGVVSVRMEATWSASGCDHGQSDELVVVKPVGGATLVVACELRREGAETLCRQLVDSGRTR